MIARAAGLSLALVAALGGTALADRLPAVPGAAAAGPAASVRLAIPAATPALVCPGYETAVVPDGGTPVPAPGPYAVTAVAGGPGGGTALGPLAGTARRTPMAGTGDVRVLTRPGNPGGALRFTARGAGSALAAVQVTLARRGDLRGLTAVPCGAAATDTWLVGGATSPGRRARLLLANPTPAAAVVDVRLAGPAGPVDAPSLRGLVVAPGRIRAVLLDAVAPGLAQLAVHVVARSGRVSAVLHDSWLRGAVPAGTDDVAPGAAPSRHVVVPGVLLLPGGEGRLRLASTTDADAVVRYRVVGPAGDVDVPGPGVTTVPAGGVTELPLRRVPPGVYSVVLDADAPVVAAASLAVSGPALGPLRTRAADLAWAVATEPLAGDVTGAVPRPVDTPATTRLVLTGGDADARVALRETDGAGRAVRSTTVAVPAGRTVGVVLAPATAAVVVGVPAGTPVHAALAVAVADRAGLLLTVLPLQPAVVAARVAPPAVQDPTLGVKP